MAALFDWDPAKDEENRQKHGVAFRTAQLAFLDPRRVLAFDAEHSQEESRFYCFGKVSGSIMTVRFTLRGGVVRVIGADYWRKGRKAYETIQGLYG